MPEDLFTVPARARNTDPETSHRAAREVTPHTDNIRAEVERWALGRGAEGFIDEELSAAFDATDVSSYRTRRGELTQANTIVDTGRRRPNSNMRQCIVWMHRNFRGQEPAPERPLTMREQFSRYANRLREQAKWCSANQGRIGLAAELIETAELLERAVRASEAKDGAQQGDDKGLHPPA